MGGLLEKFLMLDKTTEFNVRHLLFVVTTLRFSTFKHFVFLDIIQGVDTV